MGYTLDRLAADCHRALADDNSPAGREKMRQHLEQALADEEFVVTHLGPDADSPRNILYQDPDLGFCIIAHVYKGSKGSNPHDHGPGWAIYGQARGVTVMTDWRLVKPPEGGEPGIVEKVRSYDLTPGMAKLYEIGDLHSPRRDDTTHLMRIEGVNMETVQRDKFVPA